MKTNSIIRFLSITVFFAVCSLNILHAQGTSNKFVIVLDAGHGGREPGKVAKSGIKEKNIALKIVLEIGKQLEKHPDIKVVYTRKTDVFVNLFERGKIANKAKADLFVSVHCNAFHTQAYGTETYVLGLHRNETNFNVAKAENEVIYLEEDYEKNYAGFDPSSPESYIFLTLSQEDYLDQSILLASLVQDNFTNKLKRKNRGVKQAGFIVLHQTVMPSILIETGFITNISEGKYLNSNKGQNEISSSIFQAILDYKKSLEINTGDVLLPTNDTEVVVEIDDSELIYDNVSFKVQIAAGSRKLKTKSYNFNGLQEITRERKNSLYKYYYGETPDYNAIKKMQITAKQKGYDTCFIVAFINEEQVSLSEVLKSSPN